MIHEQSNVIKRPAPQRKTVHIHFNPNEDLPNEETDHETLSDSILKRQNKHFQHPKHEMIAKKSKISQEFGDNSITQPFHSKTPGQQQITTDVSSPSQSSDQEKVSYDPSDANQYQKQQLEQRTLQLLKDLLLHPNKQDQSLINVQIANNWILDAQTPTKLKSFLMLYMILYQQDYIRFMFKKQQIQNSHNTLIEIKPLHQNYLLPEQKSSQYNNFRQNQTKTYLSHYFEWLIQLNYDKFRKSGTDPEFWAMALNQCQKQAVRLIKNKNSGEKERRNLFLALFLVNCQDIIFRKTLLIPKQHRIIMYMNQEDLQSLPKCHWILGVNLSIKYFFKNSLQQRLQKSLNPINIEQEEIKYFYHEYQLLFNKFCSSEVKKVKSKFQPNKPISLVDKVIEWIIRQSGCFNMNKQKTEDIKTSNRRICVTLLEKAVKSLEDVQNGFQKAENFFMIAAKLLQRDNLLSEQEKIDIFSSILYKQERFSLKLGKAFPKIIDKLQHKRQAKMPKFFELLTTQYTGLYRHLLSSKSLSIKNDLLAQLRHLIEIDIDKQEKEVKQRMAQIFSSFNLTTCWNKEVLKSFVFLIQTYIGKLNAFLSKKQSGTAQIQQKRTELTGKQLIQNRREQLKQLKSLCLFLKIHLKLEPLNIINLLSLIQFIKNGQKGPIEFEPRTIKFIKKDLLGIIFSKSELNESLLIQVKRLSISQINSKQNQDYEVQVSQVLIDQFQKKQILSELEVLSKGVKYFENQVELLKQEAQLMNRKE